MVVVTIHGYYIRQQEIGITACKILILSTDMIVDNGFFQIRF